MILVTKIRFLPVLLVLWTSWLNATPTILILGDSLSAAYQMPEQSGWVSLIKTKLKMDYPSIEVINTSVSGSLSSQGLEKLPIYLKQYQPSLVVLELGGNDGLLGLPIDTIQTNLSQAIKLSLQAKANVLLLGIELPANYGQVYTQQFANIYPMLSEQYQITWLPLTLNKLGLSPVDLLPDGIHPKPEAQPIIADKLYPKIKRMLENK